MISWVRDLNNIDDDIISAKRKIKEILINDSDVILALNDKESIKDSRKANNRTIFSFVRIPGTTTEIKNYIGFQIGDTAISANSFSAKDNKITKIQTISLVVFCHADDIDTGFGIERHDLIGYFIREIFSWSNPLDMQWRLVDNSESITDTDYSCRTLKFEAVKLNNITKQQKIINNIYNPVIRGDMS